MFLKRASVSVVPLGLIGYYSYKKKFSPLKTALLLSIPIVAIQVLSAFAMGGGSSMKYWSIFVPPSIGIKKGNEILLMEQKTGIAQK